MDIAKYVLFLHVYSAVGLFIGMSFEYRKLIIMNRKATDETTQQAFRRKAVFAMVSMLSALFTGIYLMVTRWGPASWMTVALISLGLLIIVGVSYLKFAKSAMKMQPANAHEPPGKISEVALNYAMTSIKLRIAIASGIIALMTIKPLGFFQAVLLEVLFVIIGYIWVLQKRF